MKLINKKIVVFGVCTFFAGGLFASPVEKGIEFYEVNMYETAKAYLLQGVNSGTATPEALYYLGDTYLMLNKEDSAKIFFDKSKAANLEYMLPFVGEGKIQLKNKNLTAAEEIFNQAAKKDKKNPELFTAIARAYVDFNQFDKAPAMYEKARSVKKNFPKSFVVEGDMLLKQEKPGDAAQKYQNAIYFDANIKQAYLKEARVYKHINTTRALEILDKLVELDANYIPAYVELADIYYTTNFKKALDAYEKFIHEPGIAIKEVEKYAVVLYFTQNFQKSLDYVGKVLQVNPNNFVMKRIEIYNQYDLDNAELALPLAQKFFASKDAKDEYISQDYVTYGRLLQKDKQDSLAVIYLAKAVELDSSKVELYKEISSSYEKSGQYDKAIDAFQKYMDILGTPNTSDYYSFGRTYYQAGTQMGAQGDTIAQKEYLLKADSMFEEVTKQNSESYLGYQWRARTLSSLDPELTAGLAKPLYEQTLEKLLADKDVEKRSRELIECYRYLGYYYFLNKDKVNALENFGKALELDPANNTLKEAIDEIKKQ